MTIHTVSISERMAGVTASGAVGTHSMGRNPLSDDLSCGGRMLRGGELVVGGTPRPSPEAPDA